MNGQPQPDPSIVPQFKAKTFRFKLGENTGVDEFEPTKAIEWLNGQILAGWQLYEFNKLFQDGELVIIPVVVRPYRRQVTPAGDVPTVYEPRTK